MSFESKPGMWGQPQTTARTSTFPTMSSVGSKSRSWSARPLADAEWAEAEKVAGRLATELKRVVEALPEHARHASGMARHLGVLRATCQRVVQAVGEGGGAGAMLTRLPGVEGLRLFVDGLRAANVENADVESALSAIESFERLITMTGGSQAKLNERLEMTGVPASVREGGLGSLEDRESLFWSAARVTGRRCRAAISIYAFRPGQDDPMTLERALAKGLIGSMTVPGGMPSVLSSGNTLATGKEASETTLDRRVEMRGRTPEAILPEFTTDPLPMVTSRGRQGTLFQVIDERANEHGEPVDVVTALRASAPMYDADTGKPSLDSVWSLVSCPSESLILDVYLHEEMERRFRPTIDALLWNASLDVSEDERWVMRLPHQPRLHLLGRGLGGSASELYPRQSQLTKRFFDHIGWEGERFIGFRCELRFPVWRGGYCMSFEDLSARAGTTAEPVELENS